MALFEKLRGRFVWTVVVAVSNLIKSRVVDIQIKCLLYLRKREVSAWALLFAVSDLMKSRAVDANVVGGLRLGHSLGNKTLSVLFSKILGKHRKGKKTMPFNMEPTNQAIGHPDQS